MNTTEQLRAIIQRQVEGKYDFFEPFVKDPIVVTNGNYVMTVMEGGWTPSSAFLLEILLDPAGLRAAYGDAPALDRATKIEEVKNPVNGEFSHIVQTMEWKDFKRQMWQLAAERILDTWLSSGGNAEQTIQTAFSLLPEKK